MRLALCAGVVSIACLATPSQAAEGIFPINQACATGAGCGPDDSAGFPVTLATPGSYVLTSDLTVGTANTSAITISADGVSLDLARFEIAGPVVCTGAGSALACSSNGPSIGINAQGMDRITIHNGQVSGFEAFGIAVGSRSRIRSVGVHSNGVAGILADSLSQVADSTAQSNGLAGFVLLGSARLESSSASSNGGNGVWTSAGSIFVDVHAHANGLAGILGGAGCTVLDSRAHDNEGDGFNVGAGSLVSRSFADSNGGDGVQTVDGQVQRTFAKDNAGYGLSLGTDSGYLRNTILANIQGAVAGGIDSGSNLIQAGPSCP